MADIQDYRNRLRLFADVVRERDVDAVTVYREAKDMLMELGMRPCCNSFKPDEDHMVECYTQQDKN